MVCCRRRQLLNTPKNRRSYFYRSVRRVHPITLCLLSHDLCWHHSNITIDRLPYDEHMPNNAPDRESYHLSSAYISMHPLSMVCIEWSDGWTARSADIP